MLPHMSSELCRRGPNHAAKDGKFASAHNLYTSYVSMCAGLHGRVLTVPEPVQVGAVEVVSSLAVRALEIVAQQSEDSLALGLPPAIFAGASSGPGSEEAAVPRTGDRGDGSHAQSPECAAERHLRWIIGEALTCLSYTAILPSCREVHCKGKPTVLTYGLIRRLRGREPSTSGFDPSPKAVDFVRRVSAFVTEHVVPAEHVLERYHMDRTNPDRYGME